MKLSAVIITFNEERNIERCLASLQGVADEVIVVDSFSKDRTEELCRKWGVRFLQHPFEGHIQQKNYALQQASHEWILSLDADEALDDQLKSSIAEVIQSSKFDGYRMNRLTNYCGDWVRHCGWYPDTKVRLVRKGKALWQGVNPHDRLDMQGDLPTGHLKGDILHYSYYTIDDHYRQIEYFGKIAANELFQRKKRVAIPLIIGKVVAQFIKSYFLKKGFLDGKTGWIISRMSAYATYRKYSILRSLYKQN